MSGFIANWNLLKTIIGLIYLTYTLYYHLSKYINMIALKIIYGDGGCVIVMIVKIMQL